jgi:hypothetical protein
VNIKELLQLRGLDTKTKIKLVRHQDSKYNVHKLYKDGYFDVYQSFQWNPIFECEYIVSFLGLERSKAKFVGVYKVVDRKASAVVEMAKDFPYPAFASNNYYYELEKCSGFDDLIDRVIIDWGGSTRSWHQWLSEKEVVEILPQGYVKEFPGFLNFVLEFDELQAIINAPSGNREWYHSLSSVAGIYLIVVDGKKEWEVDGRQYVGSAYGHQGIWGRWAEYAKTGHGGNQKLRQLLETYPGYERNFRFSILQTLDRGLTDKEVIQYEQFFKFKLGSRAFGLNSN